MPLPARKSPWRTGAGFTDVCTVLRRANCAAHPALLRTFYSFLISQGFSKKIKQDPFSQKLCQLHQIARPPSPQLYIGPLLTTRV